MNKTILRFTLFAVMFVASMATDAIAQRSRKPPLPGPPDCPQWGGTPARNNVSATKNLPIEWEVGEFDPKTGRWLSDSARNIKWVARLGSQTYGTPIIAGNRVFCATNNGAGYLARYPADVDLGCLLAFDRADGRFLWQLSREKLEAGRSVDWPQQGICCSPMVENDRLWIVTNRGEVMCLDVAGFADGTNDGPYRDEPSAEAGEADIVWLFDMMKELGTVQHNMASCSVTAAGDLLLINTSNGVDDSHDRVTAPDAPSFIALDKQTGQLVWADNSPGANILHGQWSSAAFAVLGGVPQAIFAGGDGWVYSFLATRENSNGRPKLLWKFDTNPKDARWENDGRGNRNNLIATPVIAGDRVYIASGQDPEYGEGQGHLWCIDPTRRGDTSPELVVDKEGNPVAPRRIQNLDREAGEQLRPNPQSAAVWHYTGHDANGDGQREFEETMHRSLALVAVKDGLLVTCDLAGLVHCLDARTGTVHWTYDMLASAWGSPLVADGKIYVGDEDGDVAVFELSPKRKLLAENSAGSSIYSAPVAVGGVLYISTRDHLLAIQQKEN